MAVTIVIPRLGWSMEEGTFLGWLKHEGEAVRAGEAIFRLESEKATEEIECLENGILRIAPDCPKDGDKVLVGAVIGHLAQVGESELQIADSGLQIEKPSSALPIEDLSVQVAKTSSPRTSLESSHQESQIFNSKSSSPRARRVAAELGVDWTKIEGSGRNGRIREKDVRAMAPSQETRVAGKVVALTSLRRTSAERLEKSRQATVPVTLTTTGDATNLVSLRRQFKAAARGSDAVPTLTDFFVKLTALALDRHPLLGARWGVNHLVLPDEINIGIAVHADAGLLVPVLHKVASLSLREVASRSRELIERGRQGKLTTKDLQGGVFTVTNLGMFGVDAFTPIINHPECAVLGIGRIRHVPAFVGDKVVGLDQVALSLTFDHRIVDGAPAAQFLQTLVQGIENPGPWLMP